MKGKEPRLLQTKGDVPLALYPSGRLNLTSQAVEGTMSSSTSSDEAHAKSVSFVHLPRRNARGDGKRDGANRG